MLPVKSVCLMDSLLLKSRLCTEIASVRSRVSRLVISARMLMSSPGLLYSVIVSGFSGMPGVSGFPGVDPEALTVNFTALLELPAELAAVTVYAKPYPAKFTEGVPLIVNVHHQARLKIIRKFRLIEVIFFNQFLRCLQFANILIKCLCVHCLSLILFYELFDFCNVAFGLSS